MATTNFFEAILGKRAIKWDAFFHFFAWLTAPNEGHGLGDSIRCRLLADVFGESYPVCLAKREHPILGQTDGKGRFVDYAIGVPNLASPAHLILMDDIGEAGSGKREKLNSLSEYLMLARTRHPDAVIRLIIVTDAPIGKRLAPAAYSTLSEETMDPNAKTGWRLLPLQTIGAWVNDAMKKRQLPDKARFMLAEFVEWCEFSSAPSLSQLVASEHEA